MVEIDYPFSEDIVLNYGQPGAPGNTAGRLISRTDQSGAAEQSTSRATDKVFFNE